MSLTEVFERKFSAGLQTFLTQNALVKTNYSEIRNINFKVEKSSLPVPMITQPGILPASVIYSFNIPDLTNEDREKVFKLGDILHRELVKKGYIKSNHEYIRGVIKKYLTISVFPKNYRLISKDTLSKSIHLLVDGRVEIIDWVIPTRKLMKQQKETHQKINDDADVLR